MIADARRSAGGREPGVPGGQGTLALEAMALLFVADTAAQFFVERGEEIEGDIGGLKAL